MQAWIAPREGIAPADCSLEFSGLGPVAPLLLTPCLSEPSGLHMEFTLLHVSLDRGTRAFTSVTDSVRPRKLPRHHPDATTPLRSKGGGGGGAIQAAVGARPGGLGASGISSRLAPDRASHSERAADADTSSASPPLLPAAAAAACSSRRKIMQLRPADT